MKMNKTAQQIFDRYLLGVRRALPGAKRDDIAKEIESLLLDQFEERYPDAQEITENQLKAMLEEMGSPSKLAAQFSPQRYLISPRFFPIYTTVLKLVVPLVVGALTLSIIIDVIVNGTIAGAFPILEYLATLWNGAFSAAAFITLTFAIIERFNEGKEIKELEDIEKFKVEDLPELAKADDTPTLPGAAIEIILGVLGLAFLTYITSTDGRLPLFWYTGSELQLARIFTDNFMRFVPIMMALTGLEVSRNATYLAQGKQTDLTAWWQIITKGANTILTILMLGAFPLLSAEAFGILATTAGWDLARISTGMNTGLKVILILSLVGSIVEIIRGIYRKAVKPAF